jgi:hypothetical protein
LAPWDDTFADRGAIIRPTPGSKGKIAFPTVSPMSCSIQDMSDKGASLRVSRTFGIRETFDLVVVRGATARRCRIIRKAPNTLEVSFESCGCLLKFGGAGENELIPVMGFGDLSRPCSVRR